MFRKFDQDKFDALFLELDRVRNLELDKTTNLKETPVFYHHWEIRDKSDFGIGLIECSNCYCIYCYKPSVGEHISIHLEFSQKTIGDYSSQTQKEQMVFFISRDLPSNYLFDEADTIDQIIKWMEWRNDNIYIAMCLLAGNKQTDNPLERDLEEGLIDEFTHDYIWLHADLFDNLWKLIFLKWKKIKDLFSFIEKEDNEYQFPFKNSLELMKEILRETNDGKFLNYLKPHYVERMSERKRIATLSRKKRRGKLSFGEIEKLSKLIDRHTPEEPFWLSNVLIAAKVLAEKDLFIRTRLRIHEEIMDGLDAMDQKAACNPKFNFCGKSEEWVKGVRLSRNGL